MATHLHGQLDDVKLRMANLAAQVQQSVESAVDALVTHDRELAGRVIAADEEIDAEEVAIERACIDLIALHQPAAGDLRCIVGIVKANSDYERIADNAVNVAHAVTPDDATPVPAELVTLGRLVVETVRDTIQAFNRADPELAHQVIRQDDHADALYHEIVRNLLSDLETGHHTHPDTFRPDRNLTHILMAKHLERIGDHCTNIAEDIIYMHSGRIVRHAHLTEDA